MAKLDNWDKIRRNVYFVSYLPERIDKVLLERLKELEKEAALIRKRLERNTMIFIPQRHPLIETGLMREGRLMTVANCTNMRTHIAEKHSIQTVENITQVNDLTNFVSDSTLQKINYDGEVYMKISAYLYEDKEILRLSCVQEKNI